METASFEGLDFTTALTNLEHAVSQLTSGSDNPEVSISFDTGSEKAVHDRLVEITNRLIQHREEIASFQKVHCVFYAYFLQHA